VEGGALGAFGGAALGAFGGAALVHSVCMLSVLVYALCRVCVFLRQALVTLWRRRACASAAALRCVFWLCACAGAS
jgi:hypothetical protein